MRVISQDGNFDFPYENSVIFHTKRYGYDAVAIQSAGSGEIVSLAKYSTKEKALKAMGMLRKAYTGKVATFQNIELTDEAKEEYERCNIEVVYSKLNNRPSEITFDKYQNLYFQFPKDEDIK